MEPEVKPFRRVKIRPEQEALFQGYEELLNEVSFT